MVKSCKIIYLVFLFFFVTNISFAQSKKKGEEHKKDKKENPVSAAIGSMTFRSLGPAFASGRIADFAVNPKNPSEYYVAVASGHVWKTVNNGISFKPVFDKYGAYSIGCVVMDPNNSNIVWVGTGENNHQRELGYGNGVYKTVDGGKSWTNMGLKNSRQIGEIYINPKNSNIVLVAAEGSAWGPGGDRGLYKTTDGGKTWKKVIKISENTGVNNIVGDPSNPDILYATSEQRRRHVHTKIGGGPETKVYKSEDGGDTWKEIMKGLPKEDLGGSGIAVSPVDPNVVYLIVEAANDKGGFFRSLDKGESWSKMSNHTSSGQYYNQIWCDPKDVDKIYSVETFSHYSEDGGKTWKKLGLKKKHVDDHAMWINPANPSHFIIGSDGGIYVTYDAGANYRHISNLPVTQFYRVYLDNAKPFYNVYGGTQDNNSFGGPSRSLCSAGIHAAEWVVTVGGDGFWGAVDPKNSNIVYSEYQYGNLFRYDKKSGQRIKIKPVPGKNELTFRWNWNAPFIISPHNTNTLYFAANKLFKSENRGNSWQTISPDLTAQIDRNTWAVMGKYWSADAVKKDISSSLFGTIVSLDESPLKKGLLFVGTDDGIIQVSEDDGKSWTKYETFPGVPKHTYVSDIFADRFDENTLYASFNNLKRDDFKPYLFKSTNKGKSWTSISSNLPQNGSVHTISQDFKNKNILFCGTEFGFFVSINGGKNWTQIKKGIPDVAVRDIAIQKRENDIVIATFGRGFYVLDNYDMLRHINDAFFKSKNSRIFPVKDALQYIQTGAKYGQGETEYFAKNPPYGAVFTYYLNEAPLSTKDARVKKEKKLFKNGEKIPQPSMKQLEDEKNEEPSFLLFTITDDKGTPIKKLTAKASKGVNSISWNLKFDNPNAFDENAKKFDPFKKHDFGILVKPGKYYVSMALYDKGTYKNLTEPQPFNVVRLHNSSLPDEEEQKLDEYLRDLAQTLKKMNAATKSVNHLDKKVIALKNTALNTAATNDELMKKIKLVEGKINSVKFALKGVPAKASYEELPPHKLPVQIRLQEISWSRFGSTAPITETEKEQLAIVKEELPEIINQIKEISNILIPEIEKTLNNIDASWTPGRIIENR